MDRSLVNGFAATFTVICFGVIAGPGAGLGMALALGFALYWGNRFDQQLNRPWR